MHGLSNAKKLLPRQWLQSVLLHGVLLLCAVLYHLHSHRSLHFGANSVDKRGASANIILSDNNSDFLELSFEQYEMIEPQQTDVKLTDTSVEAPKDAPIAVTQQVLLDASTRATKKTTTEVVTGQATESAVSQERVAKQTERSKSLAQRIAPARSAQASTQPALHVSPSGAAAQPRQAARPDHAQSPKPIYPLALRDLGVSGVVWLRVWVDHNGRPREIELAKGSGYRLFDEAALRAVQHWHFIPAKNEQQSLASWVEFAVRFVING